MRTRLFVILAVVVLSVWAIYPPRDRIKLGLDLHGGVHLVLRVKTDAAMPDETVRQAMAVIERRVNELGVSEPVIARYTEADQILVQLPGVADVDRAKQIIKSTSQLRLTLVERGPFDTAEAARLEFGGVLPAGMDILPWRPGGTARPVDESFYVVQKAPAVTGADLRDVRQSVDEYNQPAVAFTLTTDAAGRFGDLTALHVNGRLATVVDNRVVAVARIMSRIDDRGQIVGISREEMLEQIVNLKSGSLPADLEYVEEHMIGASLGASSIRSGLAASVGGLTLVLLFMLGYYRRAGVNAAISIGLNLLILVGFVAWIPVTMTLPGIAGLILTIGMGVDSNVLIFERIREELERGRGPRAAIAAGFDRVWITIVDTHVTSLIAAALLFQFGTGPIKGFATTLTIGLLANVFTSVFASRTFFELKRRQAPIDLGWPAAFLAKARIGASRWGRHAIGASTVVIAAGAATIALRGMPLGVEFSGGTLVVAEFAKPSVTEDAVRAAVADAGDVVVQRYGRAAEQRMLIRLPVADAPGPVPPLDQAVNRVTGALRAASLPDFRVVDRQLVSATIGQDLQRRGLYAAASSIAAVTAYIAWRFRPSFAVGAITATVHDVLVTLAGLSLAGYDLSLNVTAALLTIIGYSVNDTIVVFDRVRENVRTMRGAPLDTVIDLSVNQTLARTCVTAGATFLAVLAIYLFGGNALRGFAFTMLVGIASGTYSTVFIASTIAARLAQRAGNSRAVEN
jgi:SecD/SecF fusion protein